MRVEDNVVYVDFSMNTEAYVLSELKEHGRHGCVKRIVESHLSEEHKKESLFYFNHYYNKHMNPNV